MDSHKLCNAKTNVCLHLKQQPTPLNLFISLCLLSYRSFLLKRSNRVWSGKKRTANVLKAKKGRNMNPKHHSKWADRHQPHGHTAIYWGQGSHHSLFPLHSFFLLLLLQFPIFFPNWLVFISFYNTRKKGPFSGKNSQANFQSKEFRTNFLF